MLKNIRMAAILAVTFAIVACDKPEEAVPTQPEAGPIKRAYRDAPEGSKFFVEEQDDAWASRCWPDKNGYDCVQATGSPRSIISIFRFHADELPQNIKIIEGPTYSCNVSDTTLEERIADAHHTLVARREGFGALASSTPPQPWDKLSTEDFAAQNGLKLEGGYFNCPLLRELIMNGSVASLGTTLLKHEDLDLPVADFITEEDEAAALQAGT